MSIQAIAWVLEYSDSTLAERLVLLAIANHADARGWNAYPAVELIAKEARVARSTAFEAIQRLEEAGELTVVRRPGRSNMYGFQPMIEGSRIRTGEGVQDLDGGVQNSRRRGPGSGPKPLRTVTQPKGDASQIRQPDRCASCDKLEFDCLCDRGPLIQGIGRR